MIRVINDLHEDPSRVGGTTEASREALQLYTVEQFKGLLERSRDADYLMILGDLFNKAKVEEWVFFEIYQAILDFYDSNPDCGIIIVRGNHDSRSKDRQNLCSLELLGKLLGTRVDFVFNAPLYFEHEGKNHLVIPHVFNQAQFDADISNVDSTVDFLYIHANVDNPFATGDHSLNLSKDQVKTLHDKGVTVICGHEHQRRRPSPNVYVIGNQYPTSIADCKGNAEKSMLVIESGEILRETTWTAAGSYYDVPVHELDTVPANAQFVRVSGESTKVDFAKAIQAIDKFRRQSNAFVVSNAISVITEDTKVSTEAITGIDVVARLIAAVPEQFRERVSSCQTAN